MNARIIHGDMFEALAELAKESVDACVTDPPYGIGFMGSGSTGRGALLGGFQFIGIEREAEYVEISRQRIRAVAPLFAEVV